MRGESVLSVVFTKVFVCIHTDLQKSMEMFEVYGLFFCSKYAKINGDVLSMCPLDVLSSHLEHFPMFY